MPDYTEDYHTHQYSLDAFSDEEYRDPQKQSQIENLLAAARGVARLLIEGRRARR